MKYVPLLLIAVLPFTTFARSVDTRHLDDDPVDRFNIPVLFALALGDITPDFGAPRGGGTRTHEGQDFVAPKGTPIVSPTEAVVLDTGTWSAGGKYVQTINPGTERFRYMHLEEIADIDVGDRLNAGDYIGTVGDTGNAPDSVYHLHFEILNQDGDPVDPFERLDEAYDLDDQIEFLDDVFQKRRDNADYAHFLVKTFPAVFRQALAEDIDLPRAIKRALKNTVIEEQVSDVARLTKLIESIPSLLPVELKIGDSGALVTLLQIYLIYGSDGTDRDRLAAAGPTGYYGGITAAAVEALQDEEQITKTGIYNTKTQQKFAGRNLLAINLGN